MPCPNATTIDARLQAARERERRRRIACALGFNAYGTGNWPLIRQYLNDRLRAWRLEPVPETWPAQA